MKLLKIICLAMSMACYNTIFNMTMLKKVKDIKNIPLTSRYIQTQPTTPIVITTPIKPTNINISSSSSSTPISMTRFNTIKPITIQPWNQLDIKKWNSIKIFVWNQWTSLKNKIQSMLSRQAPVSTPTEQAKLETVSLPMLPTIQPQLSIIAQLDSAQSLQETEVILKNQETKEQNQQQKLLNISLQDWQNLQKKILKIVPFLKNALKSSNPSATKDPNIPQQISQRLDFFLYKANINPLSIRTRWQTINFSDSFGHNIIVVTDPQGFIPATITLNPDKINALSPEEIDMHLIHAVTHLTEGDHTKLQLLQETVGTEKYTQYTYSLKGKKYLDALETNAQFLWSIQDKNIAKIAQKDTFLTAFKLALNLIQNAQHNIIDIKSDEIVCPDLTGALSFLNNITALSEIQEYFSNERKKILKAMYLSDDQIKELEENFLIQSDQMNQYYKQKKDKEEYDPTLPSHQLELTKKILKQTGIEPSSIIINALPRELRGVDGNVLLKKSTNQTGESITIPVLSLAIIDNPEDLTATFKIAHEVGHLLKHHLIEQKVLGEIWETNKSIIDELWQNALTRNQIIEQREKLRSLWELEADAFAAILYADIAQTNYNAMLQLGKKEGYSSKAHVWKNYGDPTYLETGERLNLYNKIVNLHKQKEFRP